MLEQRIKDLELPALLPREQMLEILQEEVYGKLVPAPTSITFEEERHLRTCCAGNAVCNKVTARCVVNGKEFAFPFYATLHTDGKKHPFFVLINFRDCVPDLYMPTEELVDSGFSVLSFGYNDVTTDDGDFTNGLAGVLYENGERPGNGAGKLAMWAWAAQRVMDYACTQGDVLDIDRAVVCGHSRLGKTALLAGATDERFAYVYSNDSGCSGAAITREKQGERVKEICQKFPFWFCENYKRYIDNEQNMPFDQHYLAAAIAPRRVLIGSATEDLWADPVAELLCCVAAGPAFKKGFTCPARLPVAGDAFLAGDIGYHLRQGKHYFSRADWHRLIEFVNLHQER